MPTLKTILQAEGLVKTSSEVVKINRALSLLQEAAEELLASGEEFYEAGDNYRGNIRHDAGTALLREVQGLRSRTGHLASALRK